MAQVIKYDLIGANKSGINEHPQLDVQKLGMKVIKFEGVPIADCVMMEVENLPAELPDYIELSEYKIL